VTAKATTTARGTTARGTTARGTTARGRTPTAVPGPPRRTRPSADATRGAILAAALDVFSERGFDGASTREIASRAGVTQPLLNYHFSSKDELWRAAVDGIFAALADALTDRARGLRGVDEPTTARLLVREFIGFSARNPQLHRIITQECKVDGPRMDWLVEHHVRPMYEAATALFAELADQGHVPAIPPAHLYYILTGAGPTMFVLGPECRRLSGLDPSADEVIEAHADAVCLLLFGR
jgi:TetR/AcrR family transcriptional regulator